MATRKTRMGFKTNEFHGEQNRHPVVAGDAIYLEPFAFHLKTGEPLEGWSIKRGGCGQITASATTCYFRDGTLSMADLVSGKKQNPMQMS